jgi:hypothetical protein
MASFIKISKTADVGTGVGFFINPKNIVFTQNDNGDQIQYIIRLKVSNEVSTITGPYADNDVYSIGIEIDPATVGTGYPLLEAINQAVELALTNDNVVIDVNRIVTRLADPGYSIIDINIGNV